MGKQRTKSILNEKNEALKDEFRDYLTKIKSDKVKATTAEDKIRSVRFYEELFNFEDFELFNEERGSEFYSHLKEDDKTGVNARIKHLNALKEFFLWYFEIKCNIKLYLRQDIKSALNSLEPSQEDIRLSRRITYVDYPTDADIKKLMDLPVNTVEDLRNRALISYMLLTAARIDAVATITINSIDFQKLMVKQDPLEGTHTKLDKLIYTRFMVLDKMYLQYLKEWVEYVKSNISGNKILLFPQIKNYASGVQLVNECYSNTKYNEIIKKMCRQAGIKDYNPHSFRHYMVSKGLEKAHTGKELKALSQNIGHWEVETILEQYANMRPDVYSEVICNMFENTSPSLSEFSTEELIAELQARAKASKF